MSTLILENISFPKLFFLFCLITIIVLSASNWILITEDAFYYTLGEQFSSDRINQLIEINNKWNWIIYPIIPVYYLLKILFIVISLSIGSFLLRYEINLKLLFRIVLISEFTLLLPLIIKLFWFSLVDTNYNLNDLQYFAPLSLLSLFGQNKIDPWFVYPLQLVNLFELAYWLALAYLLTACTGKKFSQMFAFVSYTYGASLLLWVVLVMFITVSLI